MAVASRSPKRSPAAVGGPSDSSSKTLKMEAGFTSHGAPPVDAHSVIAAAAASGSSPWASTSPRNDEEGFLRRQLNSIAQMVLGRQPSCLRRLQNLRAEKEADSHTQQLVERVRRGAAEAASCGNSGDAGNSEPLPIDARAALATLLARYGMTSAADVLMSHTGPGPGSGPGPGGGHPIGPGLGPEGEPIPTLHFSSQRGRRGSWF